MEIHAELHTDLSRFIVVETAGANGGQYGQPVVLRTVRLDKGVEYTGAKQKEAEILESWQVDGRNRGPRSNFGKTLDALEKELPGHAEKQQAKERAADINQSINQAIHRAGNKGPRPTQERDRL